MVVAAVVAQREAKRCGKSEKVNEKKRKTGRADKKK